LAKRQDPREKNVDISILLYGFQRGVLGQVPTVYDCPLGHAAPHLGQAANGVLVAGIRIP
jgi:hypothetical protein